MATVQTTYATPGRGREFVLLLFALGIGAVAYAQVGLNAEGTIPGDFYLHVAWLAGLAFAVHAVLRIKAPYADPVILPIVTALNGIGLAMIYRLDLARAARGIESMLATRQLMWTTVAVGAAIVLLFWLRDHRTLRRYTYTAMVIGVGLLMLPLIPGVGATINGARIWIHAGPFSLQPSELAKIALAVFFAGYLVTHRDTLALAGPKFLGIHWPRLRDLGPILIVWIACIGVLVSQRDLGTSLLFFGLFVAMLYISTERISWIVLGVGLFIVGAALAASQFGHVAARFDVWLNAFDDELYNRRLGGSYQLVQGLFGLGNGGLFGTGWGQGRPDLVPFAESDFIITSLGEELGMTGLIAILLLYLVLVQRGFRIAIGVRDGFGKLLAGGLAFVMAWQLFVVIGGITRIIPLTGLTTPFLAYGGSSLLSNWLVIALLLRISNSARRPAPDPLKQAAEHDSQPIIIGGTSMNLDARPVNYDDTLPEESAAHHGTNLSGGAQ